MLQCVSEKRSDGDERFSDSLEKWNGMETEQMREEKNAERQMRERAHERERETEKETTTDKRIAQLLTSRVMNNNEARTTGR